MTAVERIEVIGIDFVRFMAASTVVIWHFAGKPFLNPAGSTLRPLMPVAQPTIPPGADYSWFGWIGVQVFFVISGAVIAWSATRNTGTGFFIGRVARLWPAMIICATLCSVLSFVFWPIPASSLALRYISSIMFYPLGPWYSGQVWTLPVEIAFYAVVWALVATKRIDWLEHFAWILALSSFGYWCVAQILNGAVPGARLLQLLLLVHGCYFATGIILAKATTEGMTRSRLMLLIICSVTAFMEIQARSADELNGGAPYLHNALVPYLAWGAATFIIWGSMEWRAAIANRLQTLLPMFKLLGALTYPLYLVHYQTGAPIFAALYGRGWPVWLAFIPAYAVALAFAFVIAKWVEPRLSKIIGNGLRKILKVPAKERPARS